MTPLQVAGKAAMVCAAISAVALARRRPAHAPAAVALTLLAVLDLVGGLTAAALTPYPVEPWQGTARVVVYLDGAINLGTSATVAGLAVAVASGKRLRLAIGGVIVVWALASVVLAALYPSPLVRGAGLQRIYLAADLFGLFTSTVALISWARAGIEAKRSPDSAGILAMALVGLDALILLMPYSPWRDSIATGRYDVIQVVIVVFFTAFVAVQVILWRFSAR
jgi:hypothetical protein